MKFNKWTLGLAAVGAVSLASAAKAEEKMSALQTALASTTISGYVDTSAQWNFGTGNANNPPYKFGGSDKADGFNLNVVQLRIDRPLDESEWAAGYRVDLWFGPDANVLGTPSSLHTMSNEGESADFALRQAYIALRMPFGNGIDWKVGVFDSVLGYESVEAGNNPNYTRSYGHTIEPQTHTGILGSYRFNDNVAVSAGIANTKGPHINARAFGEDPKAESFKTYMGSITLTAPDNWGALSGSTLYAGVVNGFDDNERGFDYEENSTSWYVGGTLATPVTGLRLGVALDYLDIHNWPGGTPNDGTAWSAALYASYQATEKLSLHLRGEYLDDQAYFFANSNSEGAFKVWAFSATAQYDLWKNVISRVEVRWDHSDSGDPIFGEDRNGSPNKKNAVMLAANVIYKF